MMFDVVGVEGETSGLLWGIASLRKGRFSVSELTTGVNRTGIENERGILWSCTAGCGLVVA